MKSTRKLGLTYPEQGDGNVGIDCLLQVNNEKRMLSQAQIVTASKLVILTRSTRANEAAYLWWFKCAF